MEAEHVGEQVARPARKQRVWLLVGLGVVAVALALGYVGLIKGTFRTHEKVAIVTWNEDSFWDPTALGAAEAAQEFGVDLTFVKSKPDAAAQTQHVRDLLDAGVVGLAISPNDPRKQKAIIDEAAGKAVVVTFDSDAPDTKRRGFIGTDDYAAGQIAAGQVREAVPGGGQVIVSVGSVEMSNGRDRRQGLIDDLLDRPVKRDRPADPLVGELKGKSYSVVATVTDNGDAAAAVKGLTDAIKAHPDVKCIVGLFSYSGPAVVKAIEAAGKKGQVKVIGFDETGEEQAAVASGAIYSSVLQNQYRCGYETVKVLAELIRGTHTDGPSGAMLTALPVSIMSADNIASLRSSKVIRDVPAK